MRYFKLLFLALCCCFAAPQLTHGQGNIPTVGTDFWLGFMDNHNASVVSLDLFVSSPVNTAGTVEIPLQNYSQNFTVVAGVTTTVTLPINMALNLLTDQIENRGIHVTTQDTVALFAINFESFTADATKILPVNSTGTDYMIMAYQGLTNFTGYESEFMIVATQDGTEVEITTPVATLGGHAANTPWIVQMDEGETYQVKALAGGGDLTGTTIVGTAANGPCRPFAVFSGAECTYVPAACSACDHLFEQNYPVDDWGTTYYTVPYAGATSYTFRVLARDNGTVINVDGNTYNLNAGQVYEENSVTLARCITSNNPVNVTQFMEGTTCTGSGDPAMVILNAESQKITDVTFATVNSNIITQHNANIIVEASGTGTVSLDGTLLSSAIFTPYTNCPSHSYATVTLTQGSHRLTSPNGFTAYIYGTGSAESYAYSVGSFTPVPISPVDTVLCDSLNNGFTLAPPVILQNPWWYEQSNPNDTVGVGNTLVLLPPVNNGIYVVSGEATASGCVEEYLFSVESPNPPNLSVTASDDTLCLLQTGQLHMSATPSSANFNYTWTPNAGVANPSDSTTAFTALSTGWYVGEVYTTSGCTSAEDSVFVVVTGGDMANFDITANPNQVCFPDSTQLVANGQAIAHFDPFDGGVNGSLWQNVSNGSASTNCGSTFGDALYFTGNGVRSAETNDLNTLAGGTVDFYLKVASASAPCEDADPGEDIVLEYSNNGGGAWVIIATYDEANYPNFTQIAEPIPAAAQTASTRFRWRQVAHSGGTDDNWALDNAGVLINDLTAFTMNWTPAANVANPTSPNTMAGTTGNTWFELEVVAGACTYVDSVFVETFMPFTLDAGSDTTICDSSSVQLNAVPSVAGTYAYTWTPTTGLSNPYSANPLATPTSTTTYIVEANTGTGCVAYDTITVTLQPGPMANITTSSAFICEGDSLQIDANLTNTAGYTISWNNGSTLSDDTVEDPWSYATQTTTYVITLSGGQGACTLVDSITVPVVAAPVFSAVATNETCLGNDGILDLTLADTTNQIFTLPSILDFNAVSAGTYLVIIQNAQGCQSDTSVTISTSPGINITVSLTQPTCYGDPWTANATATGVNGPFTFDWGNGPGTVATHTFTPTATGTLTLTVGDQIGCLIDTILPVIVPAEVIANFGNPLTGCAPLTVDFVNTSQNAVTYDWTFETAGTSTDVNPSVTFTQAGSHDVTLTAYDANGCSATLTQTDYITVIIPDASITANPPITDITDPNITFTNYSQFGDSCIFLLGDSTVIDGCTWGSYTHTYSQPGEYTVTMIVINDYGCADTVSFTVIILPLSELVVPNVFSPNSDGSNDVFQPLGQNLLDYNLQIYNRWGKVMFESNDLNNQWDGTNEGRKAPDGTYYWIIRWQDTAQERHQQTGHVTLIR